MRSGICILTLTIFNSPGYCVLVFISQVIMPMKYTAQVSERLLSDFCSQQFLARKTPFWQWQETRICNHKPATVLFFVQHIQT